MAPRVTTVFGLQLPGEFAQLLRLAVEEDNVDGAVVGHQLADLGEVELHQAGVVAGLTAGVLR